VNIFYERKDECTFYNNNEKKQPPDMQGVDITPVLNNPNKKVRECCYIEHDEELDNFNLKVRLRHLITDDYKLTVAASIPNYGDLYDRKNDPWELKNLWYDENYKEIRNQMTNKLLWEILKAQSLYPKRLAKS